MAHVNYAYYNGVHLNCVQIYDGRNYKDAGQINSPNELPSMNTKVILSNNTDAIFGLDLT